MPAPIVTPLPDPPLRTEDPATFVSKAEAWVAALGEFVGEANALAAYMESLVGGTLDSDLAAIAALSTTPFGRGLLELANAGAARATLGVNRREFISQIVGTALGASEVLC